MATRTVDVTLTILGRKFTMSCTRELRDRMIDAAATLNSDLQDALGTREASNSELIDNLIALALEYQLQDLDEAEEQSKQRIRLATEKLEKAIREMSLI